MPNIIILQGEYSTNDNKIDRKQFYNTAFTLPFIFRCLYKLGKKTRNRSQKRKRIVDCLYGRNYSIHSVNVSLSIVRLSLTNETNFNFIQNYHFINCVNDFLNHLQFMR
jgi:hypothetical protein